MRSVTPSTQLPSVNQPRQVKIRFLEKDFKINTGYSGSGSMSRSDQWNSSSLNMVHSYVNIVDRSDSEEPKPALPARNSKTRSKSGSRSSRSKERKEREAKSDYEKIKESEKELERIHRRSRELMNSGGRGRDGSGERGRPRILDHHCRISAAMMFASTDFSNATRVQLPAFAVSKAMRFRRSFFFRWFRPKADAKDLKHNFRRSLS